MRSQNTTRSRLGLVLLLTAAVVAQAGCVSVDVRLADLMSADRAPRSALLPRGYAVQDLVIQRGGQRIGLTHAHHPKSTAVVVFCGGNQFHRSISGGEVLQALARGADVVLFDYPGYGESTGTPTPAQILSTALAVYDYADGLVTSADKKRVLYGFSLGGLVAASVARVRRVDGVVLEATAANAARWARSQIPWVLKPFVATRVEPALSHVDAVAALANFHGNVLVLAGGADRQVPPALAVHLDRALRRAGVNVQLVEFPGARHGEIAQQPEFDRVFHRFLNHMQEAQWVSVHH